MCTLFLELSNTVSIQIESSSEMLTYAWIQFHWIFEIHCKHFFNKIFAFYTLVALARIWSYVYCELWFYCSWTSVILPNIDIQHCIAFHVYTWPSVAVATILSQYQDYRAKANFKVLFRYWLCAIDNRNTFLYHHLHILVQRIFFFKSIPVCYVLILRIVELICADQLIIISAYCTVHCTTPHILTDWDDIFEIHIF